MPLFPLQSKGKYPVEGDGSHNEALRRVPLDRYSLDKRGGIVTIDSDQAVADAIRILGDRLILSAPVRDVTADAGADWKDKYLGCIDFLSIINWLMDSSWGLMPASLDELRHLKRRFAKTTIANLLSYSRATPFIPLDLNTNDFVDAMILLGKYGIRRVFTVDGARGDILGVISQRNAIEVIASNLGEFEDMRAKTLQQLGIAHECDVVSVDLDDSYWDAFLAIHEKGVNSVAILDENRKVIGNISMGDLKRVITSDAKFASLGRPLRETWKHEHDLYTCKPTDTFEKVCETFAMTGVHSLYVVDPQFRPIGVVRVRDLLSSCVREPAVKAQAFNAYFTGHRAEIMQE